MDLDDSLSKMKVGHQLKNLNAKKYELQVSASNDKKVPDPYALVQCKDIISLDLNDEKNASLPAVSDPSLIAAGITKLDATITSLYRDIYDARGDLELLMATYQVSFHSCDHDNDKGVWYMHGHLKATCCRRNSVIIFKKEIANATYRLSHAALQAKVLYGGEAKNLMSYNAGIPNVWVLPPAAGAQPEQNVFVVSLNGIEQENYEDFFHEFMQTCIVRKPGNFPSSNKPPNIPLVYTAKSPLQHAVRPPTCFFQGYSLGEANMDKRDGDNVFSVLRSGAMTVRNGPWQIVAGDDCVWIRHSEIECFDNDGTRLVRPMATYRNLKTLLSNDAAALPTEQQQRIINMYTDFLNKKNSNVLHNRRKIDPSGDLTGPFPTFIVAPMRSIAGCIAETGSIMDYKRRVGTAISNAGGGAMVDLLLGSDI
jgi:hypothetical protein